MINTIKNRLYQYALLVRLNKPIGILLLLWPTLWALCLASHGHPSFKMIVIFCLGTVLMRSAGCAINDFADRDFDGHVKRTANRPLATGKITSLEAVLVFVVLALIAFLLVLMLNRLTLWVSLAAVLIAAVYPFTKRILPVPQFVLGLAFAMGVPMAYAAVTNSLPVQCWLLYLAAVLWPIAYDTYYAMVDKQDDLTIGIHSTAIYFGQYDLLAITLTQALMLLTLFLLGMLLHLSWIYYCSLFIGSGFFIYQFSIARLRDPAACFKAFLNNNWFGLIVFVGILLNSVN